MFSGKLECVRPLQNLLFNAGGLQLPSNGDSLNAFGEVRGLPGRLCYTIETILYSPYAAVLSDDSLRALI
jgi:hypothetical protein